MGPSVNGLDKLLTMPTGCGEQNMIGMAPDVFVYSYLSATHQLSSDIQEKAIKYMEQGESGDRSLLLLLFTRDKRSFSRSVAEVIAL